jgi:3',5'-cyclic AMP phosphodiesterase CpdA
MTPDPILGTTRSLTRRRLIADLGLASAAVLLSACGSTARRAGTGGSTLNATWVDPSGDGTLSQGPGAALLERTELSAPAPLGSEIARLAHLTDAHILDAQSPARVTFLNRLGAPFTSTFRPQEALTAQVLNGAVRAINAFGPDAVIQGGDLIDNAQTNELEQALAILAGGSVRRASGTGAYVGVQSASNPDPFYYRPEIDAPRHPGLLASSLTTFSARGLRAPVYPVLGDHDILVAGVLPPSSTTQLIAVGDRAVWELPSGLSLPSLVATSSPSPDGLDDPQAIDRLIGDLARVPSVTVPADLRRRELTATEGLARLRGFVLPGDRDRRSSATEAGIGAAQTNGPLLDYRFDVGSQLRVIVLDLVRRAGGSGGVIHPGQPAWLAAELRAAGERWVLVVSHQPLDTTAGGPGLLALLDAHPRTLAALWGHTHRNRIVPRPAANGGYWLIATASLVDFPQQARALRVRSTADGGAALETWVLDHVPDTGGIGDISRELSYIDAQGGRPKGFAGGAPDRNVRLYRGPPGRSTG